MIENLFKKYVKHKDVIVSSSMNWLELMIEEDENGMLTKIVREYNNDRHKSFFSLLVNNLINTSSFLDTYVALLNENIEKERKLFIAMFLYFMNKTSPKVISVLIGSPLDTFNNCEFGLMEFIKKDIDRGTNIFKTFESSLKEKKISLSFENSHEMLKEVIKDIGSPETKELDEKLLNFITEYYIENENIDWQHRIDIIRPSRFYLIKNSNKTIQKIFQEKFPEYLDKKVQNIKIEDDISQEKNIFVWDIEKVIKERWNLDDFLKFIRYSHKKKVIELVTEFQFTDKNIKALIELMFNQDVEFQFTEENIKTFIALMFDDSIELKVRRDITKALYENDFDNDKVLQQLTEYINKTDLKFIVRANPKIESSSNFNVINALVEKLNRYYDEEEWLVHYFKEYNLYAFLNNEKVVDILFRIVRSTSISSHNKKDLLRYVNYKDISSDKVSDTLIEFIVDRKKYFYNLDWDSRYEWQVVDELIKGIESISDIKTYNVLKGLIETSDDNVTRIKSYSTSTGTGNFIYSAWENIIALLARSFNPSNFLEDKNIPEQAKKRFARVCGTESLLMSYKTEYEDMGRYVMEHLHYHNLPLYIKSDKKIYTIYQGKEIFTQELNSNVIDKIPNFQKILKEKSTVKDSDNRTDIKPLIITEGKTDWMHLKKALERFQSDEFNLYQNLEVEFKIFDNISMSDSELDHYAQAHAKKINSKKLICIFDRDLPKRVEEYGQSDFVHVVNKQLMNTIKDRCKKEYGENSKTYLEIEKKLNSSQYEEIDTQLRDILTGKEYKEWETQLKNNVYAFCIPKLNDKLDEICIEFYYKEKDLKQEDSEGKRLFTADEFEFKDKVNNCNRFVSKCGKFKTDTQSGNNQNREVTLQYPNKNERGYVYRIEDEECIKSKNINLSKNDFVKNIINEVDGFDNFDIENFKLIFDVIEKIIND